MLVPGVVRVIEEEGGELRVAVFGGFVEVNHDRVSILSDAAELADTIDVDAVRRVRDELENILRSGPDDEAEAGLRMADVRLAAGERRPPPATTDPLGCSGQQKARSGRCPPHLPLTIPPP